MLSIYLARRTRSSILVVLTLALIALPVNAQEWSRFRGPNGSGVSQATGLPIEFGPDKNVVWEATIPFGRSSPIVAGDKIFLTAINADKLVTLALSRSSGKELWRRELDRGHVAELHTSTDSSTPTPVSDGENVYVFFHEAGLVSYSSEGAERWRLAMGPFRNFYSIAASPVLAGNTLFMICDKARGSFLLALDKNSGKELWRRNRPARLESYATPILYPNTENPNALLILGSRWLDAYGLATGENLWSLGGLGSSPVSSPVLAGDLLFVNAPDHASEPPPPFSDLTKEHDADGDGLLVKSELEGSWINNHFGFVDVDGNGSLSAEDWDALNNELVNENWGLYGIRLPGGPDQSHMQSQPEVIWNQRQSVAYIPSVLVYDGLLYMVKDSIVSSFDPSSGKLVKRGRLSKNSAKVYASPVAADGKVYISTLDGKVAVLASGPQWEVLAINDFGEEIHASPAIVDGRLLVRTKSKLYSIALPSKALGETDAVSSKH
jgi:outer membrane protein assembly factor BamB